MHILVKTRKNVYKESLQSTNYKVYKLCGNFIVQTFRPSQNKIIGNRPNRCQSINGVVLVLHSVINYHAPIHTRRNNARRRGEYCLKIIFSTLLPVRGYVVTQILFFVATRNDVAVVVTIVLMQIEVYRISKLFKLLVTRRLL